MMNQMRSKKKQQKDKQDKNKNWFMILRRKIKKVKKFLICLSWVKRKKIQQTLESRKMSVFLTKNK